ncbi:MAG: hypothetical protein DRJ05_15040, partial [Bacteroidetes bacterium]
MKTNLFLIIFILLSFSISAKKLGKTDMANIYNEKGFTETQMEIYHTSDSISTVYMNIQLKDFHYRHYLETGIYKTKFKISYELFLDYESKSPIDTASVLFSDTTGFDSEIEMIINFDVKAVFPNNYVLRISLFDLYSEDANNVQRIIEIDKSTLYSRQNFLMKDSDGYPLFGKAIDTGQYFIIESDVPDSTDLYIRYFKRDFPLAKPP